MKPALSVVMSVYNQEPYIRESIDSVLNQTFPDFELIIIDDGSTDASDEIVRSYSDPRIRYVLNGKNMGIVATSNRGLKLATGKYIARLDSDDVAHLDRFRQQYEFLEGNTDVGLVGSYYQTIEAEPRIFRVPLTHAEISDKLLVGNCFGHSTIMFRRDLIEANNLCYPNVGGGAEDYAFYLQCIPYIKMANMPEVLQYYRVHESQISHVQSQAQTSYASEERLKYVERVIGRSLTKEERAAHVALCSSEVQDRRLVRCAAEWAAELMKYSSGETDVLPSRVREKYRKSVRRYGPTLFADYARLPYTNAGSLREMKFQALTSLSWLKNRVLSGGA